MYKKYSELNTLSTDILNITSILMEHTKKLLEKDEEIQKIYPILELLNKKADSLALKIYEFEENF